MVNSMNNIPRWLLSVVTMAMGMAMGYGLLQGRVSENTNVIALHYEVSTKRFDLLAEDFKWLRNTLVGNKVATTTTEIPMQMLLSEIHKATVKAQPNFGIQNKQ